MKVFISYGTIGRPGKIQMALKSIRIIFASSFIFFILFATLIPTESAQALSSRFHSDSLPLLNTFVSEVKNGQSDQLRGIYIPEILAAPVVQQPDGNNEFVSPRQNIVTQFGLASQFGSIGLLAHNNLAGENFSLLEKGQTFYLIYGDGHVSAFIVTEILRYQALDPNSPSSKFISLNDDRLLTASELFTKVYNRQGQVILQTCISTGENLGWGRLFVIAEPYSK
jgi:hypothetical protein